MDNNGSKIIEVVYGKGESLNQETVFAKPTEDYAERQFFETAK